MDFLPETELTFEQAKWLTQAMFEVAKVDGTHDREMTMIRSFYESCTRAGDPRLDDVLKIPFDIEKARPAFATPEAARLFTKTLIMLSLADGVVGDKEKALIQRYAQAFGVTEVQLKQLYAATREWLLAGLSHVQNTEALARIARDLKLSE